MENKKTVSWDEEIVFTNWTDKDFTGMWNKKLYPLKPGKSYYLPFYLAEHFAKGLCDREYNIAFNAALSELKTKFGGTVDRQTLEHRVQQSDAVRRISFQEMMDKCVTYLPKSASEIDVVNPKEVPLKEAVLNRDERGKELKEKYPDIEVQVNQKALDQFEEEKT